MDAHQLLGNAPGQRTEQHGIDEAEDGGGGAHPDRQREGRDQREERQSCIGHGW